MRTLNLLNRTCTILHPYPSSFSERCRNCCSRSYGDSPAIPAAATQGSPVHLGFNIHIKKVQKQNIKKHKTKEKYIFHLPIHQNIAFLFHSLTHPHDSHFRLDLLDPTSTLFSMHNHSVTHQLKTCCTGILPLHAQNCNLFG